MKYKDVNGLSEKQYEELKKDVALLTVITTKTVVSVSQKYKVDANEILSLFMYTLEKYAARTDLNNKHGFSVKEGMEMLKHIMKIGKELNIE